MRDLVITCYLVMSDGFQCRPTGIPAFLYLLTYPSQSSDHYSVVKGTDAPVSIPTRSCLSHVGGGGGHLMQICSFTENKPSQNRKTFPQVSKSLPQDIKLFPQVSKTLPQDRKSLPQVSKPFPQVSKLFPQVSKVIPTRY